MCGQNKTSKNPLFHKSKEKPGQKPESTISELYKLTKGL